MTSQEEELRDWRENGSEDRDAVKMQLPTREVCGKLDEYEREEQWLAKQRKCMAILRNDHTHRSSNSFNEHFSIPFLILVSRFRCTWTTGPNTCGMPTNTNMHLLVQSYWDTYIHVLNGCMQDIRCEYVHLVINYVYVIQHQASKILVTTIFDFCIVNTAWQKFVVDQDFHGLTVYEQKCPW